MAVHGMPKGRPPCDLSGVQEAHGRATTFVVLIILLGISLTHPGLVAASGPLPGLSLVWPIVPDDRGTLGQDYAQYDLVVSGKYHTGLDIVVPAGKEVKAAADGVVVKIQGNDVGCNAGVAGACEDHGFGNTVIVEHDLGGIIAYSQYSHLASIDQVLVNACGPVDADRRQRRTCSTPVDVTSGVTNLGTVGGTGYGQADFWPYHLHFEVKDFATLGTLGDDSGEFGYTAKQPDLRGYHDPVMNLHNVTAVSPSRRVRVTQDGVRVRVGPGGMNGTGYRVIRQVAVGQEYEVIAASGPTATPACGTGWYQVRSPDGTRLVDTTMGGEIRDGWICRDFLESVAGTVMLDVVDGLGVSGSGDIGHWSASHAITQSVSNATCEVGLEPCSFRYRISGQASADSLIFSAADAVHLAGDVTFNFSTAGVPAFDVTVDVTYAGVVAVAATGFFVNPAGPAVAAPAVVSSSGLDGLGGSLAGESLPNGNIDQARVFGSNLLQTVAGISAGAGSVTVALDLSCASNVSNGGECIAAIGDSSGLLTFGLNGRVDPANPGYGVFVDITFVPRPSGDSDGDGVTDDVDNCPFDPNPGQADTDGDGIGDACDPPTDGVLVTFGSGSSSVGEADGSQTVGVRVYFSGMPRLSAPVGVAVQETGLGSATSGDDYLFTPVTLSFPAGLRSGAERTVALQVVDDSRVEGNETVVLSLAAPSGGAQLGSVTRHQVLVVDDDLPAASATVSGEVTDAASGAPVVGATVTLGVVQVTSDGTGHFEFAGVAGGSYPLQITATGFVPYSGSVIVDSTSAPYVPVAMQPESTAGGVRILSVRSRFSSPYSTAYFLHGTTANLFQLQDAFDVEVDWGSHPAGIVHFYGPTGGAVQSASGSYEFTPGQDFPPNGRLLVVAEAGDGVLSAAVEANMVVMDELAFLPTPFLQVRESANGFEYTNHVVVDLPLFDVTATAAQLVPLQIPFFGGAGFDFRTLPATDLWIQDGVMAMYPLSDWLGTGDPTEIATWDLWGLPVDVSLGLKITGHYLLNPGGWAYGGQLQLVASTAKKIGPYYGLFVVGPVPVPWYTKGEFTLTANGLLGVSGWIPGAAAPTFQGNIGLGSTVRGTVGAGVTSLLSIEGQLAGTGDVGFRFPAEPTLERMTLSLTGGVKVTAFLWQWEHQALLWNWDLYGGQVAAAAAPMLLQTPDLATAPEPRLMPRNYAGRPLDRLISSGSGPSLKLGLAGAGTASPTTEAVLAANVYPYSRPALSTQGGQGALVWLYDDPARTAMNRTVAVHSHWDGAAWSTPVPIDDDGTADFDPRIALFADGTAVTTWANVRSVLADTATLDEMAGGLEIATAHFDGVSWSAPQMLTDNAILDRNPQLGATAGGDALLTWVANGSNDLVGSSAAPNQIFASTWDGSTWSAPTLVAEVDHAIVKRSLVFDGGTGHLVVAVDMDDDLTTIDDQELFATTYAGGLWGTLARLTNDAVGDTNPQLGFNPSGDLLLAWMRNGALVTATNLAVTTPTTVATPAYSNSTADFRLATAGDGRLALVWADASAGGADLFAAFYDPVFGDWGSPKQLTFDSDTERDLTVSFLGSGALMGVYNKVAIQVVTQQQTQASGAVATLAVPTPGTTDLAVLSYETGSDVAISSGGITHLPINPAPGSQVTTTVSVANMGDTTLKNLVVALYDGDPAGSGVELARAMLAGTLTSGVSADQLVDWVVPVTDVPLDLYVVVDPDGVVEDRNRMNNIAQDRIVLPDLTVQTVSSSNPGGGNRNILVSVANKGVVSSVPTKLTLRQEAADGAILAELSVPALAPFESIDLHYVWNVSALMLDTIQVYAAIDEAQLSEDLNRNDNAGRVDVVLSGDDDGDGVTNLLDNCDLVANVDQADSDSDGVGDACDNCTQAANTNQLDTDADGIGNVCDCDFNNDNFCGGPDFTLFIGCFNKPVGSNLTCQAADMNGDNFVGGPDFTLFIGGFNGPPGP